VKVYPFIAAEKAAGHQVRRPCALLGVSRSAFYVWSTEKRSMHAQADSDLGRKVRAVHEESRGTYGAPRVHQQLRREGIRCGKKRVARLMRGQGLAGRQKRQAKRTTIADRWEPAGAVDLVQREFTAGAFEPDQVWVGDISYLRTWEGWAYLATVIDLASRRVVGFAVEHHMRSSLVIEAMEMALRGRRPAAGLIFHSDRGSQYTSAAFRELLAAHQVRQSLSRPRQCWDNAVAESFFGTLKTELVYRNAFPSRAAVRTAVFEYIEVFYNRKRIHSALGYRSPADYEASRPPVPAANPAA
jgi:putative transposase